MLKNTTNDITVTTVGYYNYKYCAKTIITASLIPLVTAINIPSIRNIRNATITTPTAFNKTKLLQQPSQ